MRTVASVGATTATCASAWRSPRLSPTMRGLEVGDSPIRSNDCDEDMRLLLRLMSPPLRWRRLAVPVVLSRDPFANVRRAVLQPDAVRLAAREKRHGLPVDETHLREVERAHTPRRLFREQPLQLGEVRALDATTQREANSVCFHRSADPEHRGLAVFQEQNGR